MWFKARGNTAQQSTHQHSYLPTRSSEAASSHSDRTSGIGRGTVYSSEMVKETNRYGAEASSEWPRNRPVRRRTGVV